MNRIARNVLIAAGVAGATLAAAAPAEARTFVSVGFGGPIGFGYGGYGGYGGYPSYRYGYGYYPAYYAPPVVYGGGWYGRPRYWGGRPGWGGGYGWRGGWGGHRGWGGHHWR